MAGQHRCSVDCCYNLDGKGLPFFRCPKDEARCEVWKKALNFTGTHRFANLTASQCHNRIRICSVHFTADSFTNPEHKRLHKAAVPCLNLDPDLDTKNINVSQTVKIEPGYSTFQDVSVQTDDVVIFHPQDFVVIPTPTPVKIGKDPPIPVQDNSCQTEADLALESTREQIILKQEINLENEAKTSTSKNLLGTQSEITIKDVVDFCEKNYSATVATFLKDQHILLSKLPKATRYTNEMKQFALAVYFLGPKAYKKLSSLCRLPSKATLERYTKRWVVEPGFNDFIFQLIECRVRLLTNKSCVLCLAEIPLKSNLFYNISKDKIVGFQTGSKENGTDIATHVMVVMARGIVGNWKQPIAYFFHKSFAPPEEIKNIIFDSVRRLKSIGLHVLGVVSDQGSNFQKLVKQVLKLTEENTTFSVDDLKLVYLFDVPDLLQSTCKTFFSCTLKTINGETNKMYLEQMYNLDKEKQYKLAPKLSNAHIYPNNFQKMDVTLASQIFSHSVGVAMHTYIDFKVLPKEAAETANFILKMNDVFDLLNSSSVDNPRAFTGSENQKTVLKEMDFLFKNLQILNPDRKDLTKHTKFIFGWRLTINSIFTLREMLKNKGYRYIFTRHLNKECFEDFFDQINTCWNARIPTPIQFCRAFKKIYTSGYFDQSAKENYMQDVNEVLLHLGDISTQDFASIIPTTLNTDVSLKVNTENYLNLQSSDTNALVIISEYLLKECLLRHTCDLCTNFVDSKYLLSEEILSCKLKAFETDNTLTPPFGDILDCLIAMEIVFINSFNDLACQASVGKKIKTKILELRFSHPCKNFPFDYFVTLYVRLRIYFTLKYINQCINSFSSSPKLSILRKL